MVNVGKPEHFVLISESFKITSPLRLIFSIFLIELIFFNFLIMKVRVKYITTVLPLVVIRFTYFMCFKAFL